MGKYKYKIIFSLITLSLIWALAPVYNFFAHNHVVPFTPIGWLDISGEYPASQNIYDTNYAEAGSNALEELMRHQVSIDAPGITAAVAINGELIWEGASGWADVESNIPVTPKTKFRIGSTSKALSATALARLLDAGIVELDVPISQYIDDLPNPEWNNFTIRQLASHMSGLPHYEENRDWVGLYKSVKLSTHYDSAREALNVFDTSPLLFEAGAGFHYSSFGTVLYSAVLSAAAEKPFLDLMQSEVFAPLGMISTGADTMNNKAENLSKFYVHNASRKKVREWRPVDLSHKLAGGGFISTSTDLVRLGISVLDNSFISKGTLARMWEPQTLLNGNINRQNYAIGWRVGEYEVEGLGMIEFAHHGGVSKGAQSWLMVVPKYNLAVAININSKTEVFTDFSSVARQIIREFVLVSNSL